MHNKKKKKTGPGCILYKTNHDHGYHENYGYPPKY